MFSLSNKAIIKSILKHFESYLNPINKGSIINDWKRRSFLGDNIKVKTLKGKHEGTAYDLDKELFLVLKDKKGNKVRIIEGDIIIL